MFGNDEWEKFRSEHGSLIEIVQGGAIRIALLFGSVAVAIALLLTPVLDRETRVARIGGLGIDNTVTGSVATPGIYTLHRSVLQNSPNAVCVIHFDGIRAGDC
ncbi:MAG: hypothetical protein L0I29_15930 [Hyphomicrobiales bacterium]|nr:hypothetical protein [Hyphomicrobiales bacterium]